MHININRRLGNGQWSTQGEGGSFPPPRNPGKFAKDGEQPRTQPAIRIDTVVVENYNFRLIFPNFY